MGLSCKVSYLVSLHTQFSRRAIIVFALLLPAATWGQPWNNRAGLDSMLRRLSVSKEDSAKSLLQEFISYCYLNLNHDSAVFYARGEMETARRIGWKRGIANGYADIGNCYITTGNYVVALANYYKGLAIYEELNFKYGISALSNNIAGIYKSQQRYDEALKFYLKALYVKTNELDSTFTFAGMSGDVYIELASIGNIYQLKGDPEKAISYHIAAIKNARAMGSMNGVISPLIGMAEAHKSQEKYDLAAAELHEALSVASKSGIKGKLSDIYSGLAVLHYGIAESKVAVKPDKYISPGSTVNLQLAVDYMNKAIAVSRELGFTAQLHEQLLALSEYYSLQGNYQEAFSSFKESTGLKDTLFSEENKQKIATLENQRAHELKDKDIRIAELEVAKKRNERGFFIGGFILLILSMGIVIRNIQRRRLKEKQADQLTTMIETQESERKRISRDLHDDIGTKLSALGLFVSSMKEKASAMGNDELNVLAKNSEQFIMEAVADLRELLLDLSPSMLEDFGYVTAVEGLVNKINETRLIHFNLVVFGGTDRLSKNYELALYRITQELVNNVLKHADAKKVTLQIGRRDDLIILMIEDDGKGFEIASHINGYGLKNLSSRTELLQGKITIDTAPGKGTSVLVEIPYRN